MDSARKWRHSTQNTTDCDPSTTSPVGQISFRCVLKPSLTPRRINSSLGRLARKAILYECVSDTLSATITPPGFLNKCLELRLTASLIHTSRSATKIPSSTHFPSQPRSQSLVTTFYGDFPFGSELVLNASRIVVENDARLIAIPLLISPIAQA